MGDLKPCPRCLALYEQGKIRGETVMPLPEQAPPRAIYGTYKGPCCHDCQAADNMFKIKIMPEPGDDIGFTAARIVVGNERQEMFRMPGFRIPNDINRLMRPRKPDDLGKHQDWLELHGIELGERDVKNTWSYWAEQFPEAGPDWDVFAAEHKIDQGMSIRLGTIKEQRLVSQVHDENHYDLIDSLCLTQYDDDNKPTGQFMYRRRGVLLYEPGKGGIKHTGSYVWRWERLSQIVMTELG